MAEISLQRLLIKNTGAQMIGQAVSLAMGFATSFVLSRHLGVEGFGKFNYIFAFFYFFLTFNDFGINTIIIREVSKHRERANEIIGAMLAFRVLLAVAFVLLAWLTIFLMKFPAEMRIALCIFSLILPLNALQLPSVIFQVMLKAEYPVMIGIFNRCAGFLLMMGAVWMGYGLTAVVSALILAEFSSLLVLLSFAKKFVRPIWRLDLNLWKTVLRSSLSLGIAMLFVAMINRVDFLMLERMTDLQQVGLYAAAYKVTNMLEALPLMIMGTIYPLMSRYASEDLVKLRVLYKTIIFYLALIAFPLGIIVTLYAPLIVRLLFGDKFAGTEQGLRILVWASVFLYIALVGGNLLISMGKEKVNLILNILGAALNIGLNFFLIPARGYTGAALATAATYLFILIGVLIASSIALYSAPAEVALAGVKNAKA